MNCDVFWSLSTLNASSVSFEICLCKKSTFLDYSLKSNTLEGWLQNEIILQALEPIRKKHNYMDSDQLFCAANDEDYDPRSRFLKV